MTRLTVEQVDRLAQERPPYPPPSDDPAERCTGKTGWHRPQPEDWNAGNRESVCTWCSTAIERAFADGVWTATVAPVGECDRHEGVHAKQFVQGISCCPGWTATVASATAS